MRYQINKERYKERYQRDKGAILARHAAWKQQNKDKICETMKRYGARKRDSILAYGRQYRLDNADKVMEWSNAYKTTIIYRLRAYKRTAASRGLV